MPLFQSTYRSMDITTEQNIGNEKSSQLRQSNHAMPNHCQLYIYIYLVSSYNYCHYSYKLL